MNLTQYEPDYSDGSRRVLALLVDLLLVIGVARLTTLPFNNWAADAGNDLIWILILIVFAIYCVLLEWRFGRTLGKFVVNVRVVSEAQPRISFRQSLVRNLLKFPELVLAQMISLMWLIAIVARSGLIYGPWLIFGPPPRQRWGDQLAGTYVIRGPWKPVLMHGSRPASSEGDSAFRPTRYPADGSSGIRLSGRKPKK